MALNTIGLPEAYKRKELGTANEADLSNISYAESKGYKLPNQIESTNLTEVQPEVKMAEPLGNQDVSSLVAGTDTSGKGLEAILKKQQEALPSQNAKDTIDTQIAKLSGDISTNKTADIVSAQDKYNLDTNVTALQENEVMLAKAKAEFDAISEQNANNPISSRIIGGTQDKIARQKAVELAGLSAVSQAYQGNITLATETATKAVNAKYAPQEEYLVNLKDQLSNIYYDLTVEEKKKADALNLVIAEREKNIATEKELENNINNVMINAAQNGADQTTLTKIKNSTNYADALINSGDYIRTSVEGNWEKLEDSDGNEILVNTSTGETIGANQSQSVGAGVVETGNGEYYDIASYATDPNHETAIQSILNGIGQFKSIEDIDNYIQSKYPTSKITGQMIANASTEYGVSWEMMVAIMAQDSSMGTAGLGAKNNNPGNIGQFDELGTEGVDGYKTLQDGVNAVAKNLAWRKTDKPQIEEEVDQEAQDWAEQIRDNKAKLSDITSAVEEASPGLKSKVVGIMKTLPPSDAQIKDAENFIKDLKELRDSKGLKYSVGPVAIARGGLVGLQGIGGSKDAFLGKADTLISKKALDSLIEAKSKGATFGALSDAEMNILKSAATTLGAWGFDKKEKLRGFDVDEESFKEELNSLIADYQSLVDEAGVTQSLDTYLESNPSKVDEYNTIASNNPNLSDDDILQVLIQK